MASKGSSRGEGDWICSDARCGNTNFARRDKCNKCGKEKDLSTVGKVKAGGIEIGKALAEKSKGLFSADDWQCKTCGNVNWARRSTCNVCNTPKVGKLEERTGFGGGFMERDENPEYKERNSDDDEYDEFGRRRKKNSTLQTSNQPQSDSKDDGNEDVGEEEDDDDDDDDDDDEDLSKYQLDDSDDAADTKAKKGADRSSKSSSRSHSTDSESSASRSPRGRHSRSRSRSPSSDRSSSRSRSRSPR